MGYTDINKDEVDLNFSWVVGDMLAGCRIPLNTSEIKYLKEQGVDVLVRLVETHLTGIPRSLLLENGVEEYNEPIIDFSAPSQEQFISILRFLSSCFVDGKRVAVACRQGRGRTGTILAAALIMNGLTAEEAIAEVRKRRSPSIEPGEQEDAIRVFASELELDNAPTQILHQEWPVGLLKD